MDSNFFSKKIGGIPVIYLAGGAVVILAVVAWQMKPSSDGGESEGEPSEDAVLDEFGLADGSNPYAGYAGTGTVIVAPQQPKVEDIGELRPDTNEEWLRAGAEWLVAKKGVSGIEASDALYKYLSGASRSTKEAEWINAVIKEKGLPPDPVEPHTAPPSNPSAPSKTPVKSATKNVRVSNVTKNSFKLDWEPIPGVAGYQVHINGKIYGKTILASAYTITGRKPKTSYNVTVYGVWHGATKGSSDWQLGPGKTVTVRTK